MAITDTPTAEPTVTAPADEHAAAWSAEPTGLAALLGTGDHKVIGRLWITFSFLFGIASFGLVALSAYRQVGSATFPPATAEFQVFTAGRIGMVFLFLVPLFIGLGTYICPLQVGANTIAFPRAAAGAFWAWLVGSGILITSYATNGGIGGVNNQSTALGFVAFGMLLLALLLATVCIVTTVIALRAPGMDMFRVPLFSWSMVVAGTVWLLTIPVLIGNLVLVFLDVHYGSGLTFGPASDQFQYVSWVFGQPQIFAFAIPVLGILSDIIATTSGSRQPQRGVMMGAIGAFGVLSIGAWAQAKFDANIYNQALFIVLSVVLGLPILILLGGWASAIRKGNFKPSGPLLAGLVSVLLLLLGWVGAVLFAITPLQLHELTTSTPPKLVTFSQLWSGTYPAAQVGLTGVVVLAATTAALAALFYWGPKITGSRVLPGGGYLVALAMLVATLAYGPPFIVFAFGNKRPELDESLDAFSWISVAGATIALVTLAVVGLVLLQSRLSSAAAADDPWETGQTLEWATSSPPPKGNFALLDEVSSPEPVLDLKGDDDEGAS